MNVILCLSYSGKVVTFQESLFACKRKLSKPSRLLHQAATGNCPDRLGWVTARLMTAITCDTDSTHVTMYRKPTHTDQYLNFESNHHIEHKRSVVRTLLKRADVLVTKPEDKSREVEHVKCALRTNQYEEWAFEIPRAKPRDKARPNRARTSIGLPYIHGTSEKLTRIFVRMMWACTTAP